MLIYPAGIPTGTGYTIENSVWFDGSADYLSWTPSSAGSKQDFTISFWIKLIDPDLSSTSYILSAGDGTGNEEFAVAFLNSETLRIFSASDGSTYQNFDYRTSQVFRDPTAWQNWVISFDHNNGTAGDRIRLWINGSEVADADFGTSTDPVDGETVYWTDSVAHNIGRTVQGSNYVPMYLADFICLDGTSVTDASSFGETNSSGVWVPVDPSGLDFSGNNSFHLDFAVAPGTGNGSGTDASGGGVKQDISGGTATNPGGGLHGFSGSGVLDDDTGQDGFYLSGDEAGQTVDVDLGSGNDLAVTGAGWIVENNGGNDQAAVWSIFYSDNGSDWTDTNQNLTVADNATPMGEQRTLITGQTAHRYWRLSIDSTTANNNGWYSGLRLYTGGTGVSFLNNFTEVSMTTGQKGTDSPTDNASSNIGNTATLNPLIFNGTLSEGNLKHTADTTGYLNASIGTVSASSGKFYHEIDFVSGTIDDSTTFGVVNVGDLAATRMDQNSSHYVGHANGGGWAYKPGSTPKKWTNSVQENYGVNVTDGDTLQVYTDLDNGKLYFGKNGTLMESANLTNGTGYAYNTLSGQIVPAFGIYNGDVIKVRFSPADWEYTPANSDYKSWSTQNLTEPTVTDPSAYFFAKTYTGNSDSENPRNITGFQDAAGNNITPDWVWIKSTSDGYSHTLWDSVRGFGNGTELLTDANSGIGSQADGNGNVSGVVAGGFTATESGSDSVYVNEQGKDYVAWMWKAGGAPTTDNISDSGSPGQTPTNNSVFRNGSASTTAFDSANIYPTRASIGTGISILKYTGNNSSNQTLATGLTGAADFAIIKRHTSGGDWAAVGIVGSTIYGMELNNPTAESSVTDQVTAFGNGTITIDGGSANDPAAYSAFIFQKTSGLIGVGTYTANASTNGPSIIIDDGGSGFRPAWVMAKEISNSGEWRIFDNVRDGYNPTDKYLRASTAEYNNTGGDVDFLSNGFKLRNAGGESNSGDGDTYLYLAFAEHPFGGDNINQARAR